MVKLSLKVVNVVDRLAKVVAFQKYRLRRRRHLQSLGWLVMHHKLMKDSCRRKSGQRGNNGMASSRDMVMLGEWNAVALTFVSSRITNMNANRGSWTNAMLCVVVCDSSYPRLSRVVCKHATTTGSTTTTIGFLTFLKFLKFKHFPKSPTALELASRPAGQTASQPASRPAGLLQACLVIFGIL